MGDFISSNILFFWLAAIIIFLFIEAVTIELVTIWLAIGSLFALIVSFFIPEQFFVQFLVMAVSSALMIIFVRRIAVKLLNYKKVTMNVDSFIGKQCVVTQKISKFVPGEIKFNGVLWTAYIADECVEMIEVNSIAKIVRIEGAKVFVALINKNASSEV